MAASINDLTTKASSGSRPVPTTLTAIKAIGASNITCGALTGWPTTTAVHFAIYNITTSGAKVAGSQTDWKGVVSGSTITGLVLRAGSDNGYSVGAVVEAGPTAAYADDTEAAITQDHDTQGRHVQLTDTNSKKIVGLNPISNAVNDVIISNAATTTGPIIAAEGSDSNIDIKLNPKNTGIAYVDGSAPRKWFGIANFVESGCIWTGDSLGSTLNGSMTSGVVWIGGRRLTVSSITAHAFTASKDTYVDFQDNNDGTANVTFTPITNNTTSPALGNSGTTANTLRNAIIVTGSTNIAGTSSINQGSPAATLPVVSSAFYSVSDGLGNMIYNTNPVPTMIGYRQTSSNFTTASSTATQIPGLTVPVIVPTGRKVRVATHTQNAGNTTNAYADISLWDGVVGSGTLFGYGQMWESTAGRGVTVHVSQDVLPTTSSKTYGAGLHAEGGGTANFNSDITPSWIRVDLV